MTIPRCYNRDANGYQLGYAPEHPLASKTGLIHEHRFVAYEKYGSGNQTCHWCKTPLTWKQVEVDHVDWDRANNDKTNLVTSCKACNCNRHSNKGFITVKRELPSHPVEMDMKGFMALAKKLNR